MADGSQSGRSISTKQIIALVAGVIVVVLAIANSQKVKVDFLVGNVRWPLFIVIIGSAVLGWVVGWFMGRSRS
ncbi:MAG: hypothetical protein AMXMBFR46_28420 [Acidimicrobiia bacterium]